MSFSPLYPVTEIEMRLTLDGTFRYISEVTGCYETRDVAEDYIPSYSAVARQDRHDRADGYYASVQAAASNPTFWTRERIAHIAGLRAKGYAFADIAAPLGKTEKAVRLAYDNHLRRIRGRPLEAKTPWKPDDDAKLFAMKDAGHTWNEIAIALGRGAEPCQTRWSKLRARQAVAAKQSLTG